MAVINEFINIIQGQCIYEIALPTSITGNYIKNLKEAGFDLDRESRNLRKLIINLALFTFAFAHVENIQACSSVPLRLSFRVEFMPTQIESQFKKAVTNLSIQPSTLFFYIARCLASYRLVESEEYRTILISDFGWSLSFNRTRGYNEDPAAIKPWFLYLQPGIPTNLIMSEQKPNMSDAGIPDIFRPAITVLDGGKSYIPRCKTGIKNRTEYFSSGDREFLIGIRFWVEATQIERRIVEIYSSYRRLHILLWAACVTMQGICTHPTTNLDSAKLGLNVVTVEGCEWPFEDIAARIFIVMARGDQQARWLALQEAMLRADDCREDYALDAVSSLPGKWILSFKTKELLDVLVIL